MEKNTRKDRKGWMIGCFWALLIVPNLVWPAVSPLMKEENTENRVLAQFPELSRENFQEYPGEIEDYINDHAAFRSQLLSLNAGINLALFQSVDNPQVIRGKDGWYFFDNGISVKDYRGQNLYSEEEMVGIVSKVQEADAYFKGQGVDFAIVLAPNKEEIYSEYMPPWYTRLSPVTRYDQLAQGLSQFTEVPVVAPKAYFLENRDRLWYFKTDTHWNEAGGFVAGQMLVEALGGEPVSVDEVIIPYDYRGPGDLALLFHMPDAFLEDYFCIVHGYYDDVEVEIDRPFGNEMLVRTRAEEAPDERNIAFYRDSFASVMVEKFSRYFKEVDYYHWQAFQPEYLEEKKPDVLVYEVVERDFVRLMDDLDVMMEVRWGE